MGVHAATALVGLGCADTHATHDASALHSDADVAPTDAREQGATLPLLDASVLLDASAATDAGTWAPEQALCPQRGTTCARSAWYPSFDTWSTLLEARQFGMGTRFRALHGMGLALQDAQDAWAVVRVRFTDSDPAIRYTRYALPVGQQVVALVDKHDELLVLSCPAPRQDCVVLATGSEPPRGQTDGGMLALSDIPKVPSAIEAQGMYSGFEGLCVYGRGLWCLRGSSWEPQLEGNPQIRSARLAGEHAAIETVSGTFWVSSVDSAGRASFRAYPDLSVLDPDLDQRSHWTQLRGDQLWFWNGEALAPCSATLPLVLLFGGRAVSADGTVFGYDRMLQRYCEGQQLGPLAPVVGVSHPMCGIVTNGFVLTESVLMGTVGCAVD